MLRAFTLLVLLLSTPALARPPRLTLIITVDSMGSDLLMRMRPRLKGGLGQLLNAGAFYPDARYEYAEPHTASGHTTLATGANPWRHGVVGNRTINRLTGKLESTFADRNHPALEVPLSDGLDTSPENLLAETVADRLRLATYGQGKVISLSIKARSAIAMGGRLGQAWWFSEAVGKFVTGTWYAKEFPTWIKAFNDRKLPEEAFGKAWTLSANPREYGGEDDRPFEDDFNALGRTFPHRVTGGLSKPGAPFYTALTATPYMTDILVQLARAAIDGEKLGRDDVPDLLSVSISATDVVYHAYGPYSWEMQDMMLRLDKAVGDLVSAAERAAGGRSNLLVVLSADHGGAAIPEEWAAAGLNAVRVNPLALQKALNAELQTKFGAPLVVGIEEGGVYLQEKAIADNKLEGPTVRRAVATLLARQPAIAFAVARDDLTDPAASSGYMRAVRLGYYPERSGDVLYVLRPFHVMDLDPMGTSHGAPYAYDTQVPVVFAGKGVKAGLHPQRISPVDVAPTLATLLELGVPAMSEGSPRPEVFGNGGNGGRSRGAEGTVEGRP